MWFGGMWFMWVTFRSYPSQLPLPCYEFCPIHPASINMYTPFLAEKIAIVAAFVRDQFHLVENVQTILTTGDSGVHVA